MVASKILIDLWAASFNCAYIFKPFLFAATLGCRLALLASRHACKSDAECQAPEGTPEEREEEKEEEEEEDLGFSTLSRERLLMEVETLCRERDGLIGQLRESTEAFQEQLQSVKDKCKLLEPRP